MDWNISVNSAQEALEHIAWPHFEGFGHAFCNESLHGFGPANRRNNLLDQQIFEQIWIACGFSSDIGYYGNLRLSKWHIVEYVGQCCYGWLHQGRVKCAAYGQEYGAFGSQCFGFFECFINGIFLAR